MTTATVAWLKKALEKYPNENDEVFVDVGGSHYPLKPTLDLLGIFLTDKKGKNHGHQIAILSIQDTPLLLDGSVVDIDGSLN